MTAKEATAKARVFYSNPAFTALACADIIRTSGTPLEALWLIRVRAAKASNLRGRFGLDGPAPQAVLDVLANLWRLCSPSRR